MLVFNFESQFIIVPIFIVLLLIFYKITNNAHKLYMKKNNNEEVVKSNVKENTEENNIRKDMLMVVIDVDGDYYYTAINENGCVETIDLDCNCYEKVGEYTLIETVIRLLNRCREVLTV